MSEPRLTTLYTPRYFGNISFDAVLQESHDSELIITGHPIESGASISDHAFVEPKVLTVIGFVSNHSISNEEGNIVYGSEESKTSAVYDALIALQDLRQLITVQTGLSLYENMMVANVTSTQNTTLEHAAIFECELKQLTISESQFSNRPQSSFFLNVKRDKKGNIIKNSENANQTNVSNKAETPLNKGYVGDNSGAKAEVRKQSALCKITGLCA